MATIYEAHGSFHLRLYSNVDVGSGARLPAVDGRVLRKQQSVRLCRKDDGLHRLKSSPAVQRLAADKQEQITRWEEAAANGDFIVADRSMTVADFYQKEFLPTQQRLVAAGKKSHSTLVSYQRYWDTYLKDHFNSSKTLRGYTSSIGARFLQTLQQDDGTSFGENTIKHIHSAASGIFTLAVELEYIDHNPWHDIKRANVATVDPEEGIAYTELEVETLMANLGLQVTVRNRRSIEQAQLVLAIGIWAGLRPSEIAALKYDDIDVDKGTILVRRAHVYGKTKESTKTGKERVVYYLSPLAGRLRLWISERMATSINGWLLENREGNPLHLNSISRRVIAPVAKKYGTLDWEDNAFYGARRGFGTLLVLAGASCEEVAKQMGNTREVVWAFYFKDRDSELAQSAAAKYEARKRLLTLNAEQNAALQLVGNIGEGL